MRLATREQIRLIEDKTSRDFQISYLDLMELAGAKSAAKIVSTFPAQPTNTVVLCGRGSNGGDGLVVARHLHDRGYAVVVIMVGHALPSELNSLQLKALPKIRVIESDSKDVKSALASASLIVDAVFGIGLNKAVDAATLKLFANVNQADAVKVSLDIPSGLDANTGIVLATDRNGCIRADLTLTYGLAKPGLFNADGPAYTGRVSVIDIGLPNELVKQIANTHSTFGLPHARRALPKRPNRSNKSNHGHALIFAGHSGMWGAGILSSSSAFRMGCGYVTWASHEAPLKALHLLPEVMTRAVSDSDLWKKEYDAIAIGPGLGVNEKTTDLLKTLIRNKAENVVVDADAITCAVNAKLFPLPKSWVLTPHAGELSRLIQKDVREIEADRYAAAFEGAKHSGCHILLKGYRSILATEKRAITVRAGNSALAKAGTGDVLTGMIAGLLAQGLDTVRATATAAYVHGRLADEWVRKFHDKRSLTASDLREDLPSLLGRISME